MELLFGGMPEATRFVVAFLLVLALFGIGYLLWRRLFGRGTLGPVGPRGRQPRLAVIDAAAVDARRRLVLIRRDNVEHLLMIGGPTDVLVESGISRAGTVAISREPRPIPDSSRLPAPTDGSDRTLPPEPVARPWRVNGDLDAVIPESPRTAREAMAESMRGVRSSPAAPRSPAEADTSPGGEVTAPASPPASPEANPRASAVEARRGPSPPQPQRPQPAPEPGSQSSETTEVKRPAAPTPRPAQSEESSFAEMAQRLEAALRRPTKPIESPPSPPAAPRSPGRAEPPGTRKPAAPADPFGAPKASAKSPDHSPPPDLKILAGKAKGEPPLESLEDEMAKMLGRSPGKP